MKYTKQSRIVGKHRRSPASGRMSVMKRCESTRYMNRMAPRTGLDAPSVPDAPFKTTWPELAMKRIIREAAEKGYDKVAWTPGSVQAERYPSSCGNTSIRFLGFVRTWIARNRRSRGQFRPCRAIATRTVVFVVSKDGVITDAVDCSAPRGSTSKILFGKDMARQIMEKHERRHCLQGFCDWRRRGCRASMTKSCPPRSTGW